jgi:hypothetical protein
MKTFSTLATIRNGRLVPELSDQLKAFIASQEEGKSLKLSIEPISKTRSKAQNSYYWVCMQIMGKEWGYTKEEVHEVMKIRFLGSDSLFVGLDEYHIPKTTGTLTTAQFAEYMEKVIHLAATMGIYLPDPDEYGLSLSR